MLIPRGLLMHQRLTEKLVRRSCRNTICDTPEKLQTLSYYAVPNVTRQ